MADTGLMFARIRGWFDGAGWFPGLAAALFVFALLLCCWSFSRPTPCAGRAST